MQTTEEFVAKFQPLERPLNWASQPQRSLVAKSRTTSQRPAPKSAAKATSKGASTRGGRPAGLFTWAAVGLVIVVVAALVIIKVATGSSSPTSTAFQAADPATVSELTTIPASIFNTVGVSSSVVAVSPPTAVKGQPSLTATSNGKTLPEVFYEGGEYCPFCAAQRWTTIIALSRFGTWHNLGDVSSYSGDVYPNTPSFTFYKATYTSKYLVFKSVEAYADTIDPATGQYAILQIPTKAQQALVAKYDNAKYIKGASTGSIPFLSFGNKYFVAGASYTPAALAGLTRNAIAAGLSSTTSPVTVAIIASANYQTATICSLTHNQPAKVCDSPGVTAAKTKMGIK
ncbi:MAG: hypothetical protein B7X07_05400 [Actinobacteria bacterium 21-64-8]|nr:MAG: hypothetical protein B7X07_05400 [Actinobacteria bacterium 21-64-8]